MAGLLPVPPHVDTDVHFSRGSVYVAVTRAEQVSDELVGWVVHELDILYPDRIDWEDAWDRLEGTHFADGSRLEWGENDTPAMRKIQAGVRKARR